MPISLQGLFIPWNDVLPRFLLVVEHVTDQSYRYLKELKKKTLLRPPELDMKSHSVEIIQTATPKVKETISYLCKYEHLYS